MTDQSELIRAMLDERGVEYTTEDMLTNKQTYWGDWCFMEPLDAKPHTLGAQCELMLIPATAEQAIAATLGRPTWHNSYDQKRYDRWYNSLFHGEPTNFEELIEDVIWTTETVDLGPNGNECQGVDEGEVNTEGLIESWAKKAATLGSGTCELNPDGLPIGLTISDDGTLLNWRGENYVRQDLVDDVPRESNGNAKAVSA